MNVNFLEKGFTLMEILVAIAVFSIVILTLFSSFNAFMSSGEFIVNAVKEEEANQIAVNRLERDFLSTFILRSPRYHPPDINDDPDPYRFFASRESISGDYFSRLEFVSLAGVKTAYTTHESMTGILYYVKKNTANGYDLCRHEYVPGGVITSDPCRDPVVAKNISKFDLLFFNKDEDGVDEWDSDSKMVDHVLPDLVSVRLAWAGENKRQIDTAFYIPVNRGVR